MIVHSSLQLFTSKHYRTRCRSRWENLDRGQYPFQPIKFVNLVVPSPCETEPYNKCLYETKRIYEGYEKSSENCTSKSHLGLNIPLKLNETLIDSCMVFSSPSWAV